MHDNGPRLRVRAGQWAFTKEEGYGLASLLLDYDFIHDVLTSHRNGSITIYYDESEENKQKIFEILNSFTMDDLVEGAAVNDDEALLGHGGDAFHELISAQDLAGQSFLAVVDAVLEHQAIIRLLRGRPELTQRHHGDAGFQHAPGHIAAAPLELVALAAPLGELVLVRQVLAVRLLPLGIGNVQHLPDLRRGLDLSGGNFLQRDRIGSLRQGGGAEKGQQQHKSDDSQEFLHQDGSFHGSPSIIPRNPPNGKKLAEILQIAGGIPW